MRVMRSLYVCDATITQMLLSEEAGLSLTRERVARRLTRGEWTQGVCACVIECD
jgi:hypothetical protein